MKSHTPTSLRTEILLAAVLAAGSVSPTVAQTYKVLHNFGSGTDGSIPSGTPFVDAKGRLVGNTYDGGTGICSDYGCGMTYALLPQPGGEWKEVALHEFTGMSDGALPLGNLVADDKGNLYSAENGGAGAGAVFELSRTSLGWSLTPIYGPYFSPGLLLDVVGNLYGFFGQGDLGSGAVGELSPGANGWAYAQLYSFCSSQGGCPDGVEPKSPLSWDAKGNLYGTTLYGGVSTQPNCPGNLGCGVAFQMTPNGDGTWTYHVMHRFASYKGDGLYPYAGLTPDAFGNAYGATAFGGGYGNGTIFKLSPSGGGWKKTVLYNFPSCDEGCDPGGTLVFDKEGDLYGSAGGGNSNCGYTCGVIYELIPQPSGKWKYTVVHKFTGTDGAFPYPVVLDGRDHLFGTTENGGTYNSGVAFEIAP